MRHVIAMRGYKGKKQIQVYNAITKEEWLQLKSRLMLEGRTIGQFIEEKIKEYIYG